MCRSRIKYFSSKYKTAQYYGVDLSQSMIDRAQLLCPNAKFERTGDGITFPFTMDLIYSVAVFAHIMEDNQIRALFKNIKSKMNPGGLFSMFEQTGPTRRQGDVWCRRNTTEYVELASDCGLILERKVLVAFPVHRKFERTIAPLFYRYYFEGSNYHERMINANKALLFRLLSSIVLVFCRTPIRVDKGMIEGNSFYVFKNVP